MYKNIRERLYDIQAVIDETEAPSAREHRERLLANVVRLVREEHGDPERVYRRAIATDWVSYAAIDLTTREGLPFLYSQWQCEFDAQVEAYDDFLLMNARQIGKSTGAAGEYLKRMTRKRNRRLLHVAPTEKQLEVRDMLKHFIEDSDFIQETYVRKSEGGKLGVEEIHFATNGAHFEAINLSISHSKGDTKRGKTATDIGIDEIQMVDEETQHAAIDPMLSNALPGIKRRLIRFGTFSYKYRADFDRVVEYAERSRDVGYLNVTCWDAMDDNIRSPSGPHGMRARFEKLNIACGYVRDTGVCPRALPHWYDGLDVKPAINLRVIQPGEFECNLVCYQNDTYVAEDLAQAPALGDRFFTKEWLVRMSRPYNFWSPDRYFQEHGPLVCAADIGKLKDPTEIEIAEVVYETDPWGQRVEKLRTVGNITVDPFTGAPGRKGSYEGISEAIKRVNSMAKPVMWFIDITRNESLMDDHLLVGDDALEPGFIYANSTAENRELKGIVWTGPEKARMFENHQRVIAEGRRIVPKRDNEPAFFEKFFDDHTAVRKKERSAAQYTVFEDTGHLVDTMAMNSLWLLDGRPSPPSYEFGFFNRL